MIEIKDTAVLATTSSKGNQMKAYNPDDDYWYKADYLGFEGLAEHISSQLLNDSNVEHINYDICQFKIGKKNVVGCKSKNFLHPNERLVSSYELFSKFKNVDISKEIAKMPIEEKILYFVDGIKSITNLINFGPYLTKMLQLDAVTKNDDRHFNNISFIYDVYGKYHLAPIYDNGASFLSDEYTYGSNLSYDEILATMKQAESKPFSRDFDEQLDASEKLYPAKLVLPKKIELDIQSLRTIYADNRIQQVETILRESKRKYEYLFSGKTSMLQKNNIEEVNFERD